jgi:hypothetical protein
MSKTTDTLTMDKLCINFLTAYLEKSNLNHELRTAKEHAVKKDNIQ